MTDDAARSVVTHARARIPDMAAFAEVRLAILADGPERGVRMLHFRSGGGLEWEVIVDRGFDVGRVTFRGETLSWHSATGVRAPWLMDPSGDGGQGFLRGHSGFMTTCGLDHIRQPANIAFCGQPLHPSGQIRHPLHGLYSVQPARLIGYGCEEHAEMPLLWCEAEVRQTFVFGACLSLRRRYECLVGDHRFTVSDRVRNIGPTAIPHLMLYHINLGYPLIDDASSFVLPGSAEVWRTGAGTPLAPFGPPLAEQTRDLSLHRWTDLPGRPTASVTAASGLGLDIGMDAAQLPFCQVLRLPSKGLYGLSIEPCSTAARDRADADEQGETRILEPGQEQRYDLSFSFRS